MRCLCRTMAPLALTSAPMDTPPSGQGEEPPDKPGADEPETREQTLPGGFLPPVAPGQPPAPPPPATQPGAPASAPTQPGQTPPAPPPATQPGQAPPPPQQAWSAPGYPPPPGYPPGSGYQQQY